MRTVVHAGAAIMGWELRHRRYYFYRNLRVNGKPVKQYVAAADPYGFGEERACELEYQREQEAKERNRSRRAKVAFRARIDGFVSATLTANAELRTVADGVLCALGYHKHHRGEWRMSRDMDRIRYSIAEIRKAVEGRADARKPLVNYSAPADDAEAVKVFAKARDGDAAALARVPALIRDREWVNWIGNLGRQATRQLVIKASGGDPVWEAGIAEQVDAIRDELLGAEPSILEQLLVRRVVNGWIATHALELELTLRPPNDPKARDHLDRALTRAQKRYTEAIRELARVRRLQAPAILAQLDVAATQTVVNAAG